MMTAILFTIFFTWGALCLYFARRYLQRRKPQSAIIAFAMLGWPIAIARELHWLARTPTIPFIALALTGGVLGFLVVAVAEAQRVHPFR